MTANNDTEIMVSDAVADLETIRLKRMAIIDELTTGDKRTKTLEDKGTLALVLGAMADADRISISKIKTKNDQQKAEKENAISSALVASFLSQVRPGAFHRGEPNENEMIAVTELVISNEVPQGVYLEGQLDKSSKQETYNTFMQRMGELDK